MGNCGSIVTKPCLSKSDNRYDADFPNTILEQVSFGTVVVSSFVFLSHYARWNFVYILSLNVHMLCVPWYIYFQ